MKTLHIDFIDFTLTNTPLGSKLGLSIFNSFQSMNLNQFDLISVSMECIDAIDACCVRDSLASIAKVYLGKLGVIITDLSPDADDVLFNLELGFKAKNIPLIVKYQNTHSIIYGNGNNCSAELLKKVYKKSEVTTADIANELGISSANASTQLKSLADKGFIMRCKSKSESGGIEYIYKSLCRESTEIEIY